MIATSIKFSRNDIPEDSSFSTVPFDDSAFESLFKSQFSILCAYCQSKYSFDLDLAKEAVHSGFIKLWENRSSISNSASVKAYLYKIIGNICLDLIKHKKVTQLHERYVMQHTDRTTIHGLDGAEAKILKNEIDKTVSELPRQMRRIFELSRYEGLKYAQIASLLNISVKTVETQMSRCLRKLRANLYKFMVFCCLLSTF